MCLNLSLILSHVPALKAHTSQGTIHSWNDPAQPDPDPPGTLLPYQQARSCCTTQPAPDCPPSSTWPAMSADPARQARRPGPTCPPTRPAVPPDQARRARLPGPPCPPTRPAKPANLPSRADQPGHIRCFGHDAVDPASLVSSSFLLISASYLISLCCCLKMSPFLATPLKIRSEDLRTIACTSLAAVNWPAKERTKACAASTTALPRRVQGWQGVEGVRVQELGLYAIHRERRVPVSSLVRQSLVLGAMFACSSRH